MAIAELQTFVDCLEDAVVVIDEDLRVVLANAATLRGFGWTAGEILNQPCYVKLHGQTAPCDSRPFGACALQTVRATGQPARVRHRHPDASGFIHTVEIYAAPLSSRERGSTLVLEVMREITRQAELEVETAQRHRELSVLSQITSAVARSLDPESLAPELLDLVSAPLQVTGAAIYQYRDGTSIQLAGKGADWPIALIDALADELFHRNEPLVLDELHSAESWATPLPAGAAPVSLLCLPLRDKEGPSGILILVNSPARSWSEPDVRLGAMAARQIAIGLERGRLFRAEAERARSLERANLRLQALEQARRQALRRAMTAQEDERKRIAAELHDETVQALAALVVGLDTATAILDRSPAAAREQLAHLKRSTGAIIEEIDSIIAALRPPLLDDLGLLPALQAYAAERLDPLGVAWEFHVNGDEFLLPPPVDLVIFRVVQEAINNIARHARAQRVVVTIVPAASGITVQVCDDGVGFNVGDQFDPGRRPPSLGLLGMQERLATVDGLLHVKSSPEEGTQLHIFVPCKTEGANV